MNMQRTMPGQNLAGASWPADAAIAEHSPVFGALWYVALAMLILNFGQVLGLGNINAVEKMFFLAAAVFYMRGKIFSRRAVFGLTLVFAACIVAGVFTPFAAFSWIRVALSLLALLALASYFLVTPTEEQRMLMLRSIAWTPVILIVYGLLLTVLLGKPLFMRDHTGATRLGGPTIPAFLAAASYAGVVASAFMFAGTRRTVYLFLACLALGLCTMSGTRMPTACAATSAGLILLLAMRSAGARMAFVVSGVALSAAFLLTAGDQILIRFLSGSTSGREKIWGALGAWIDRYPLTGVGFGHHGLLIPDYVTRLTNTTAAHNEYLRLLAELGYIGEGVFLAGMVLLFFAQVRRDAPRAWICTAALTAVFFLYASTDNVFFLSYALFTPLAVALGMPLLLTKGERR